VVTNRLKYGTLKYKWLNKLKQEEQVNNLLRFKKKYIKECYKVVSRHYFIKKELYTLNKIY